MNLRSRLAAIGSMLLTGGCTTVGPDYHAPEYKAPEAYTETGPWTRAVPQDTLAKGDWWSFFDDPVLADLERRAAAGNTDLQAAMARVDQARATAGISATYQLPEVSVGANANRLAVTSTRPDQPSRRPLNIWYDSNDFKVPLYASYEVDLWGKVRRQVESARAQYEASVAAFQTILLTLQGDVALTYFQLCTTDELLALLRDGVAMRRKAVDMVTKRKGAGLGNALDLARANTELAVNEAEAEATSRQRKQLVYRLALLLGSEPERFQLGDTLHPPPVPVVPVGVPSDLLQRRPDIAEAERRLVARNAEIGVATAAWFPSFSLTAAVGFESSDLAELVRHDSSIFNLGGSLWAPIFNGGRIRLNVERTKAVYAENLATYRGRVLRAFQEVEVALAGLSVLARESEFDDSAVKSADQAAQLATARFKAGLVSLLEVIDAQRTLLQVRRQAATVRGDQLLTTVALVKALGGGWGERRIAPVAQAH